MNLIRKLSALFLLLVLLVIIIGIVGSLAYFIIWEENMAVLVAVLLSAGAILIYEYFFAHKDRFLNLKYSSRFPEGLPNIITDDMQLIEQLKLRLDLLTKESQTGILWSGDDFLTYLLNPDVTKSIISPMNNQDEDTGRYLWEIETTLPQGLVKTHIGTYSEDLHIVDSQYFHNYNLTPAEMNNSCIIMSDRYIPANQLVNSATLFADMTYPHKLFITRSKAVRDYLSKKENVYCIYSLDNMISYSKLLTGIHKAMRE